MQVPALITAGAVGHYTALINTGLRPALTNALLVLINA